MFGSKKAIFALETRLQAALVRSGNYKGAEQVAIKERNEAEQRAKELEDGYAALSTRFCEQGDKLKYAERRLVALEQQHAYMSGKLDAANRLQDETDDLRARLADAENDVQTFKERDKRARSKAVKAMEADRKTAIEARAKAAARGEQWAVEAILAPRNLFGL